MIDASLRVLRTDVAGMPIEWIGFEEAVRLHCLDQILYPMGSVLYHVHGGINARSGEQSTLAIHSIICTAGQSRAHLKRLPSYAPPLNNSTLFRRDANLCLYCGDQFRNADLSRDHVEPLSKGGRDIWQNVVTACKRCNHHKGSRTPEEAGNATLGRAFCADTRRIHLSLGSENPGRPDGILVSAFSAQQSVARPSGSLKRVYKSLNPGISSSLRAGRPLSRPLGRD